MPQNPEPNPAPILVERTRGRFLDGAHRGHAVIARANGDILAAWGDPAHVMLPRSSAKILQALPLVESGAADKAGLGPEELALACASHGGTELHTSRVRAWLARIGRAEADLRCGPQRPAHQPAADALIRQGREPDQTHNNCSGKHTGFLTLAGHLRAGPEDYIDAGHPVQAAVREAFEDMCGAPSPGHAVDGCSAPNFATALSGLARAMARVAEARPDTGPARDRAAARLRAAMIAHPDLVECDGHAATDLMRAAGGRAAVKSGADGVFVAILPGRGLGIALKIVDGNAAAAACAMAALLVREGIVEPDHPAVRARLGAPVHNRAGRVTGKVRWVAG